MFLHEILRVKGTDVHTIGPEATLDDAVQDLVRFNIGSLVVVEAVSRGTDIEMIGILTERDILRAQAAHRGSLEVQPVAALMTAELVIARPDDRIEHAMKLMTAHRIRHLPIIRDGQLFGIISLGDLVKAHHDQLELDNYYMTSYIRGEGAEITTQAELP